jgi:3-oxoacyl-[acyl-carrier-protein] synthase-3
MNNSKIIASGKYLPKKILSNHDLEKIVDTSHEWIFERTGIVKRHIADEKEMTSDLAVQACKEALKNAQLKAEQIEMIIVATTTPDLTFPSTATILQSKINAINAFAFDIQAVCSGFVYALNVANNFIKSNQVKNALVVGSETLSRIVDWKDRNTCVLFGDGAGAVILNSTNNKNEGILSTNLYSDGNLVNILKTNGGISTNQKSGFIEMQGKEVFKFAVEKMSQAVLSGLNNLNLKINDIDLLIPHQANSRILNAVAKKLALPENKIVMTVQDHANTSAASIPLAINYAIEKNKINNNDLIVLEALGGGLTWGSIILRW